MLEKVRQCMASALKLDAAAAGAIATETTAAQVPGWTSVAHLALVLELEKTFGIRFDNDEIVALGSVSSILGKLESKGVQP